MISYVFQKKDFTFRERDLNNRWLKMVAGSEVRKIGNITIVFCSDNYILDINQRFLSHDYFTDIITFDYCSGNTLSGDLIISIDSVRENALEYGADFEDELNRVIVHGLLHLIGYDDHTEEDIKTMRSKENYYLDIRKRIKSTSV